MAWVKGSGDVWMEDRAARGIVSGRGPRCSVGGIGAQLRSLPSIHPLNRPSVHSTRPGRGNPQKMFDFILKPRSTHSCDISNDALIFVLGGVNKYTTKHRNL